MTSPRTEKLIKFTAGEAEEIYACLTYKLICVERGDYRCTVSKDQSPANYRACVHTENKLQQRWMVDLERLIRKIGEDGKNLKK